MNMPDLGPDGRSLQTSNPADEKPLVCAWCGKNAEDGVDVEVMDFEPRGEDHGKHGNVRLCDKCNDYRIGEWPAEDTEQGLAGICDVLGIDNMLQPFVRGERAVAKIKAMQDERDRLRAELATRSVAVPMDVDCVEIANRAQLITGRSIWPETVKAVIDSLRSKGGA